MSSSRPATLRADAWGNRARILDAADAVFGSGGEGASTEEVARLAGVGIATVFRHFETKQVLLQAVLARRHQHLFEQAGHFLDSPDPARAFFDFFALVVSEAASKSVLLDAYGAAGGEAGELTQARAQLRQLIGQLLERAQQSEHVRGDIGLAEVYALLASTAQTAGRLDAAIQKNLLGVIFDGLKSRP